MYKYILYIIYSQIYIHIYICNGMDEFSFKSQIKLENSKNIKNFDILNRWFTVIKFFLTPLKYHLTFPKSSF